MSHQKDPFESIDSQELTAVNGGAARVASVSGGGDINDQLMQMLSSIGDSIKSLASSQGGGNDQMMQMMMMMLMMGGGGGGGGVGGGGYGYQPPTYVEVTSDGGGGYGGGGCCGKCGW